ncbi:lysozyme inhibitor LprI family protein [Acinetobacter sp. KS-LM10]|uniref:lysozyme inhibitor LprI family protein n=1 Tax=Acinetobacter sp. KS-LM10 TaxID=3120518 RepID=UPI0030D013DC
MNRKFYFFILMMLFGSTLVFADTDFQVKCVPNSTIHNDILGCYIDEFKDVDKKLNTTYKNKMAILKKNKMNKLQQLQRSWVIKKERKCVVDEANYGRESHFDAIQCQIDMSKERIEFIKKYK